jgi:PAS domain S-box-containing protein
MPEQRLRESERIYRAVGESIPFGISNCEADGRNRYVSESLLKLTGMTQLECAGLGWARALHPDDQERIVRQWQQCVKAVGAWDVEMRYKDVYGMYHPVLARGVPVRDDNGRIVSWVGINLDISRLKESEDQLLRQAEELRRSNSDLEQFSFVASHDIQEPLRTVNIYTELLLRKVGAGRSAEIDEFTAFVRDGVNQPAFSNRS